MLPIFLSIKAQKEMTEWAAQELAAEEDIPLEAAMFICTAAMKSCIDDITESN